MNTAKPSNSESEAFDANDDSLTYIWDVSEGTLTGDSGPEVQWTAPESTEEMVPSRVVTVNVYVRDGSEKDASKTATILVYSKPYRTAETLSGTYTLVSKSVNGNPVEAAGTLRLTPTTFTREVQDLLEGVQGQTQFVTGTYKFIKPFNESSGTIHWFTHGDPRPSVSRYTWDGKFFVLVVPSTSTQYVYNRAGAGPEAVETDDVEPEPIEEEVEPEPIDDGPIKEDIEPEPIDDDDKPVEEEVEPEPINTDGEPIEITDATFKTMVLDAQLPVVLEFEADWCPFCRQMKPIVESVALEHQNTLIIGKLNIDENRQTTGEYKVNGIPTYLVFRDGKVVGRFGGAMPKEVFVQRILDALN